MTPGERWWPERVLQLLGFLLPTLAALGHYIPVVGSFFAFRVAAYVFLVIVVVSPKNRLRDGLRRVTLGFVGVWVIVLIIGLFVFGLGDGGSEVMTLGAAFALLIGMSLLQRAASLRLPLLLGWFVAVAILGLIALFELTTGLNLAPYPREAIPGWGTTATLGNPNDFAAFLVIAIPLLVVLWAQVWQTWLRVLVVASIILACLLVISTLSITGVVVAFVFIALTVAFVLRHRLRILLPLVLLGAVVVAWWMVSGGVRAVLEGSASRPDPIHVFGIDIWLHKSIYIRLQLVIVGLGIFLSSPFIGVGPGAFEKIAATEPTGVNLYGIASPHNGFIEILSQYGFFVFTAWVVWLVYLLKAHIRQARRTTQTGRSIESYALIVLILSLPVIFTMGSAMIENSATWIALMTLLVLALSAEEERAVAEQAVGTHD